MLQQSPVDARGARPLEQVSLVHERVGSVGTGAQHIVWTLEALGITRAFGIPGGNVIPLYDALHDSASVRHVLVRHEEGAGYAAQAYATAAGVPAVAIATSGPGATNLVTAIATAFYDSAPLLVVTGQVFSSLKGTDAFQEADIHGITLPITKHAVQVDDIADIASALVDGFRIARSGRPGPVLVDITKDAQQASAVFAAPAVPVREEPDLPDPADVAAVGDLVRASRHPVLLAGRGVKIAGAAAALRAFVELTGVPVVETDAARGALGDDHPLSLGAVADAGRRALAHADLVIAVGTGIDEGALLRDVDVPLVHIDIDAAETLGARARVFLVADAGEALRALTHELAPTRGARTHARATVSERAEPGAGALARVLRGISALAQPQTYVSAGGDARRVAASELHVAREDVWVSTSAGPRAAFAVAAGLGAAIATGAPAWVFLTAADVVLSARELATCTVQNVVVRLVVLPSADRQTAEVELAGLAAAYGADYIDASDPSDAEAVVATARASTRSVVVDLTRAV